ncbi:hypothetical protein HN873_015005 [Arachis hypogaea]
MTMIVTDYKMKKASDKAAGIMLTEKFTGQLKRWWNNFFGIQDKELIINNIKQEGDPSTFKDRIEI